MSIHVQGHTADPVHGMVGFNSSTGGTVSTEKVGKLEEMALIIKEARRSVLGRETSAHNCYGVGDPKCTDKGLLENKQPIKWEPVYKPKQDTTPTTPQSQSLCTNPSSTNKQKCNSTTN